MASGELFAPIAAARTGMLQVDAVHALYWEESGNPQGIPVVFLHGGPGAGCSPRHRCFFDPGRYRIVLLDQRGAGRSTPRGELQGNTTQALISDLETLRDLLGIGRWLVFGGSWGSTLALAYAQAHPERCLGLILRGIFLATPGEIDWFMHGMGQIYPEVWQAFSHFLPAQERADLLQAYYRRLTDPDPAVHMPAAHAWSRYEGACSTLLPDPETTAHFADETVALGLARIEAHYFMHRAFLGEEQLLRGLDPIRHLPCAIVQGRYDIVCPIRSAWRLHEAWPQACFEVIADAGHSAFEPGIRAALVRWTQRFAAQGDFRSP